MALMGIFMELVFSLLGLLIGWVWKPKWVSLGRDQSSDSNVVSKSSVGCLISSSNSPKSQSRSSDSRNFREEEDSCLPSSSVALGSRYPVENEKTVLTMEDLDYLCQLVEVKDGGPAWIPMMDRSAGNMSYQAWRRDPLTGPPQYRSRTVYEDVTPELMRDFFWDDEFRPKWDNMLIHSSTLEECPVTGTMVVQWIRKFPFFCSDREYIIGRRIWESGRSYYCVTKGVPCTYIPRRNKPRRVDLYYSSWCIRAVESKKDGQLTACEVLLFHYEDMGIPWEIAKLGIRQGMWGCVKMIQPGLQAYQVARREGAPLSRSAFMAQINSKIDPEFLHAIETTSDSSSEVNELKSPEKQLRGNILKFLVVGGAVALACSLDRGLVSKAIIFGVARRFGNIGRKL